MGPFRAHPLVSFFIYLSIYLSIYLYLYHYLYLYLSISLSLFLYLYLLISLSIYLFIYMFLLLDNLLQMVDCMTSLRKLNKAFQQNLPLARKEGRTAVDIYQARNNLMFTFKRAETKRLPKTEVTRTHSTAAFNGQKAANRDR